MLLSATPTPSLAVPPHYVELDPKLSDTTVHRVALSLRVEQAHRVECPAWTALWQEKGNSKRRFIINDLEGSQAGEQLRVRSGGISKPWFREWSCTDSHVTSLLRTSLPHNASSPRPGQ